MPENEKTAKGLKQKGSLRKMEEITKRLFEMQDLKYRDFSAKLIPNTDKEKVIGVRAPQLRSYAKELLRGDEWRAFVRELPHTYHEENLLHGYILGTRKADYEEVMADIEAFLPYIENWAVCDTISPRIFKRHPHQVYEKIRHWVQEEHEYTVRFGVVSLLQFFLDEEFQPEMLELVARIHREEYYINIAVAWYFSFALMKQYECTLPLIESRTLDPWIQNKTIQKAIESWRISDERKEYLRTLKIKGKNSRG